MLRHLHSYCEDLLRVVRRQLYANKGEIRYFLQACDLYVLYFIIMFTCTLSFFFYKVVLFQVAVTRTIKGERNKAIEEGRKSELKIKRHNSKTLNTSCLQSQLSICIKLYNTVCVLTSQPWHGPLTSGDWWDYRGHRGQWQKGESEHVTVQRGRDSCLGTLRAQKPVILTVSLWCDHTQLKGWRMKCRAGGGESGGRQSHTIWLKGSPDG